MGLERCGITQCLLPWESLFKDAKCVSSTAEKRGKNKSRKKHGIRSRPAYALRRSITARILPLCLLSQIRRLIYPSFVSRV